MILPYQQMRIRQDPTVTVTDKVNGYSLINNGKIGFVNSELRRSDMFR